MDNVGLAARLIDRLRRLGANEFCVCAGSRNSPLLAVLGSSLDVRLYSFVDERSAGFFAIGRIKLLGRPVAVVTTSGTAAAELLAATVEAHYAGLPLILVTADRPGRFRGTGAPQVIDQTSLFGPHAEDDPESWTGTSPLHLNIEFDEPLIDGPIPAVETPIEANGKPGGHAVAGAVEIDTDASSVVIVGGLAPRHRSRVRDVLLRFGAPVYAEPLSGLREDPELPLITSGERMIARGAFESVIRIGNVPTLRFWRDLETSSVPVVHFSDLPFPGLTRGRVHPVAALPAVSQRRRPPAEFFEEDRRQSAAFHSILDEEPESELATIRALSRSLPDDARIYLGNSLPVREWDLAATRETRGFTFEANRGANGIDGQLSTFFGQCDPERENVCVVGDLTALYDLGAPWIVPQLDTSRYRIIIINNGGGRIFSRVPSLQTLDASIRQRIIENSHRLRFGHWAAMWGIEERVTELIPDPEASHRAWKKYDELWGSVARSREAESDG